MSYGIQYQLLSNTISIGKLNKSRTMFLDHEEHTDRAVDAVRQYQKANARAEVVATPDDLWQLHDDLNTAGIDTSLPVLDANDRVWMSYPYEDGDCIYVGMECGDPRERFEFTDGESFYPRVTSKDPIVRYPLQLLWHPNMGVLS